MPSETETQAVGSAVIAELNDLLQLDHDALHSYTLAAKEVENPAYRETIYRYRADHERHVEELTELVSRHGGMPVEAPHPTGVAKLAQQAMGALGGGDTHVLLAFRNNERQARDKYARAVERADGWPTDVRDAVRRAAADEARHYDWVDSTLQALGVTDGSALGRAARAHEVVHARSAEAVEQVGKQAMRGVEAARRTLAGFELPRVVSERPLAAALAAVGAGVLVAAILGDDEDHRRRSRSYRRRI